MIITKRISLDVIRKNFLPVIFAAQGDINSRFLNIALTADGEPLSIESAATVKINATRSDGTSDSFSGTVDEDGSVTVPISSWMLETADTLTCNVSVESAEDEKLTTADFHIGVEKAPYMGDEISSEEEE